MPTNFNLVSQMPAQDIAAEASLAALQAATGTQADAAYTSGSGTMIALLKAIAAKVGGSGATTGSVTISGTAQVQDAAAESSLASIATSGAASAAAVGTTSDNPYTGSGGGTLVALLKGLYAALRGTLTVSGSVSVGNFPATQAVSGAVSVSNLPATQAVSGNVTVSGTVADSNSAPFLGVAQLTPGGAAVAAQRSVGFVCAAGGNATFTFPDASTITLALAPSAQLQTLPFAVTGVSLGTDTAGTFWNLK
jgi:hypothetical protein